MELDELKLAWQSLDRQLQRRDSLNLQLLVDHKLQKARRHLRPLWWGQLLQMALGVGMILLAASLWISGSYPWRVVTAGVIVHLYGIVVVVLSGITLGKIQQIDYAGPVLDIQRKLNSLRRFHVINGMVSGLPWWLLWMPVAMVLFRLGNGSAEHAGVDEVLRWGSVVGVLGLLATWWFHRWSTDERRRPQLARAVQRNLAGSSLLRAQQRVDEIGEFERE